MTGESKISMSGRTARCLRTMVLVCLISILTALPALAGVYTDNYTRVNEFASQAQRWYTYARSSSEKPLRLSSSDKKIFKKTYKVLLAQAKAGKHVVVIMNKGWKVPSRTRTDNGVKVIGAGTGRAFSSSSQALLYAYKFQSYMYKDYFAFDNWYWKYRGRYYAGFEVTKKTGQALKDWDSGKAKKAVTKWANNQIAKEISPYNLSEFEKLAVMDCIIAKKLTYSSRSESDSILYSALKRNRGLCVAYSTMYAALCKAAGFEVRTVSSKTHQWCAVKVLGRWMYIDPTWDDQGRTIGTGTGGWYSIYYKSDCWDEKDKDHKILYSSKAARKEEVQFTAAA